MEPYDSPDTVGNSDYSRRQFLKGVGVLGASVLAGCLQPNSRGIDPSFFEETVLQEQPADLSYVNGPVLGGNLNGEPYRFERTYADIQRPLEESRTPLIRAFFDVPLMVGEEDPYEHPDVAVIRNAAGAGFDTVLSLKWDFKGIHQYDGEPIPEPGSAREQELFEYATGIIDAVNADSDGTENQYVVLGNEPMWETQEADQYYRNGSVPIVEFMDNLKEHLSTHYDEHYPDRDVPLLLGAINRLDERRTQRIPMVREFLERARTDDDIAGIDLHLHYDDLSQAAAMLDHARTAIGDDSMLFVTEYSPVFRYKQHVNDPLGTTTMGQTFASKYGRSPDMQVDEYIQAAKQEQISRDEWTDFIQSMDWFNEDFVNHTYRLFSHYGVDVATVGFTQYAVMRNEDWTRDTWLPFHINFLYLPAIVEGAVDAYNEPYMKDYRRIQDANQH